MKSFNVTIKGTADILQHRFGEAVTKELESSSTKTKQGKDYSEEWRDYLYVNSDGQVCQLESHINGALIKAAVTQKVAGGRGKTFKDFFKANIFIEPVYLPHNGIMAKDFDNARVEVGPVLDNYTSPVYIDKRPVVVNRARVIRYRPAIVRGWELSFVIQCLDDDISPEIINTILDTAGKTVGIGDFRPRFGRFMVTRFEAQ